MSRTTIQIKTFGGSVLFEHSSDDNTIKETLEEAVEQGANLRYANLGGADLGGADLRYANLGGAKSIPQSYINLCSRDMLFIFEHLKAELPGLKKALLEGRVDGSQYEGECACLIGTLGNVNGGVDKVCSMIPFYEKGLENYGEQWFYQIREGDTPDNSFFAKHALELVNSVLEDRPARNTPQEETEETVEIEGKKYRKNDVTERLKELEPSGEEE